LSLC
jgi:hypothetical protein